MLFKVSTKLKEKRQTLILCSVWKSNLHFSLILNQSIQVVTTTNIQTAQGTSQNTFYHSGPVTVFYNILALFELHLALVTYVY